MKHLIISLLFIAATSTVFSQEFYGGLLAGFNGSQVEGDYASGYNKLGIVGGAWVQRDLSPSIFSGMEIKYIQKGSRIMPTKRNDYRKYVYRLNYIELPVLAGYNHRDRFSFFGGLSYAYLINKSGHDNFGFDPMVQYDDISNWEVAMLAGMKVSFVELVQRNWARNFTIELRYQHSMFSIDNKHEFFKKNLRIGQFNNVISTVLFYRVEWTKGN